MMYTAMYLPVDRPWKDGCTYLDSSGAHHQWDADAYEAEKDKERGKVADLFIVGYEFNQMKIIGQPSEAARKWVKPGMQFKHFNVAATEVKVYHGNFDVVDIEPNGGNASIVNIRCEVCNHLAKDSDGDVLEVMDAYLQQVNADTDERKKRIEEMLGYLNYNMQLTELSAEEKQDFVYRNDGYPLTDTQKEILAGCDTEAKREYYIDMWARGTYFRRCAWREYLQGTQTLNQLSIKVINK